MQGESYKGDCHSATYKGRSIRKDHMTRQWASQVVLVVKNLPANAGDMSPGFDPWVGKIPLEGKMATHPSIHAWRIPWTEEPGRL